MFNEDFEAWANGPVCRRLYDFHKGHFEICRVPEGSAEAIAEDQREAIDVVLRYYGDRDPQWHSDLTHLEDPWKEARVGLAPGQRGSSIIDKESMALYYGGLLEEHALPLEDGAS